MWSPEIEMPKSPIIDVDKNGHFWRDEGRFKWVLRLPLKGSTPFKKQAQLLARGRAQQFEATKSTDRWNL
jgi:hypothetical protein